MNTVWSAGQLKHPGYPPLKMGIEVDVAVIGGGITGLTTALRLHEAGQRVVVLEALQIGGSSTGGSTGNLYGTVSGGLAKVRAKWSEEVVREVVALRMQALDLIEETVKRLAIDCQFERCPLYFCVRNQNGKQARMLDAEHEISVAAGLAARLVDQVPQLPFQACRALEIEHQAQFNPLRYVQGLATALSERGGLIYEGSPVVDVNSHNCLIKTSRAEVSAKHIVYATHTPKGINLLQAEMVPYREYGISARLNRSAYPDGIFWVLDDSRSIRSYHDDGQDYLVVIGEKHKTGHSEIGSGYIETLREYVKTHFDVAAFEHQWSAQQYRPADTLPYIGRSGHHNVYLGTGYAADGLTWGSVAAEIITEQILGREAHQAKLFSPRRFTPLKSAKTWLEENTTVAERFVKDYLTSAQLKRLDSVAPGEGKIVELDGEKLAVYRAPDDSSVSVLSPVCPHMKCMVTWNGADSTWDCPCHGSRFATDGGFIEGPAYNSLPRRTPGTSGGS